MGPDILRGSHKNAAMAFKCLGITSHEQFVFHFHARAKYISYKRTITTATTTHRFF